MCTGDALICPHPAQVNKITSSAIEFPKPAFNSGVVCVELRVTLGVSQETASLDRLREAHLNFIHTRHTLCMLFAVTKLYFNLLSPPKIKVQELRMKQE